MKTYYIKSIPEFGITVIRDGDSFIPTDPENKDYQKYLEAVEAGEAVAIEE